MAAGGRYRGGSDLNLPNWDRNGEQLQRTRRIWSVREEKMGRVSEFAEKGSERKRVAARFLFMEINGTRRRLEINSSFMTKLPYSF